MTQHDTGTWQAGFREALVTALWDNGHIIRDVEPSRLHYGWQDFELTEHIRDYGDAPACPRKTVRDITEDEWDEFAGTFNDSSNGYGVSAIVSCACGLITDRQMRWDATIGEALLVIVGDTL